MTPSLPAAALVACVPGFAAAADSYACGFELSEHVAPAGLRSEGAAWVFEQEDGSLATFRSVAGHEEGGIRHLISTDFDPDAGAVALLSIAADGAARLSVHGVFPALDGFSLRGSCRLEG